MDSRLIGGNDLSQELQAIIDHSEVFGASVKTSSDFVCSQEVWYPY